MTKEEKQVYTLLLIQSLIEEIDENDYRQNIKRQANILKDLLIKHNNINFQTPKAVQELIELCDWHRDLFRLYTQANKMESKDVEKFNEEFEFLQKKYRLKV